MAHYLFSYSGRSSFHSPFHSLGWVPRICRASTAVFSCSGGHGDILLTDCGTGETVVLQALCLTLMLFEKTLIFRYCQVIEIFRESILCIKYRLNKTPAGKAIGVSYFPLVKALAAETAGSGFIR